VQALYACLARALSSALRGGALRALREPTYRLYNCQRCGVQVRICGRCDHGNIYCVGECSRIRRRESLRRASARYQRTRRGALCHAARQQGWRARRPIVTHQGYRGGVLCRSVSDHAITAMEPSPANDAAPHSGGPVVPGAHARCAFCRVLLPAWTRPRRWL
jgi:hypothetical protein